MTWEVYAYRSKPTPNQDGKGSAWHTLTESYDDQPSAHRRAQELVETGGFDSATVTPVERSV